jgi:HSP20 family protein
MLMRFDPWREFDRLTSQMWGDTRALRSMPMDAYRHDDQFVIHFDIPGIDPDSIELTVEKNVLTVTARRTFDRSKTEELIVSERPQGVFTRQVFLGEGLDVDELEASYDAGVLTLFVPVLEAAKPRRIPIAIGESGQQAIETTAEDRESVST